LIVATLYQGSSKRYQRIGKISQSEVRDPTPHPGGR
jgi:hypothetical protein